MEVTPREPSKTDADKATPGPRIWRPETPEVEASQAAKVLQAILHDETPTEPGYGHGV